MRKRKGCWDGYSRDLAMNNEQRAGYIAAKRGYCLLANPHDNKIDRKKFTDWHRGYVRYLDSSEYRRNEVRNGDK